METDGRVRGDTISGRTRALMGFETRILRSLAGVAIIAVTVVTLLGWSGLLVVAQSASGREVVVARVVGEIDPAVSQYVDRVVTAAERRGAEALVIVLDTPGGLDVSMREIVQRLLGAPLPVIVMVGPSGARAASAGTFIVLASDVAVMAPGTTMGAAHPVAVEGGMVIPIDPVLMEKVTNDAVGYIRGLAIQRGRNAEWAERAVRESVVLGSSDALRAGVIELVASDLEDALVQLDGRRVSGPWGDRPLRTRDAVVVEISPSLAELTLAIVAQPVVAYLLCLVGLVLIGSEVFASTGGAAGLVGTICLVLALMGFNSLPVEKGAVAVIGLGVSLLVAELKAGGHGMLAVGGVMAIALGSWWLFPDSGPTVGGVPARLDPLIMIGSVAFLAVSTGLVVGKAIGTVGRPARTAMPLPGETGVAITALMPDGTVSVRGEAWSGRAIAGTMESGKAIRVTDRRGLTLIVEPVATGTELVSAVPRSE